MKLAILAITLFAVGVLSRPVSVETEVEGEGRVKRDYDPRTDAPVRVPVDPEVEGEDRVKRDYDPRTDAPVRVPVDPEVDGEDRVKRDYDPRTDAPVRVPVDPEVDGEDRVKRDLSFSPNTEAPLPPPKHHPVKRESDPNGH
ncbi:hypothetical protein CRE_15676 [Caenorhabditis remanei]|uniref:Uncharacterized protein n=1 Tax=Caenorhabditis remanei TaxID=31234 RepID=E3N842_CAERE|nr:hypothetical protein CRE_15676 [Caenorhabditis remanei]